MSTFQPKITRHAKKQKSMTHTQWEKKAVNKNCPWVLEFLEQDFKSAITNMFKELQETTSKELKEKM